MLAQQLSREEKYVAEREENERRIDREKAAKERWFQNEYAQKRAIIAGISDPAQRDRAEMNIMQNEEHRLLAVRRQARLSTEEIQQCDYGLRALIGQRRVRLDRLAKQPTVSVEPVQQVEEEEEESRVEITMETDDIETEMDDTIIEQGVLPEANTKAEEQAYQRLKTCESTELQWRYEALLYLLTVIRVNDRMRATKKDSRRIAHTHPRVWTYLGLRNLLTRYEMDNGVEDPHTSVEL